MTKLHGLSALGLMAIVRRVVDDSIQGPVFIRKRMLLHREPDVYLFDSHEAGRLSATENITIIFRIKRFQW